MQITLGDGIEDYRRFLAIKDLPKYRILGDVATFPDEYAGTVMGDIIAKAHPEPYEPVSGLFDYQRDISELAIQKRKFAVFADCGLGKTLIMLEFARHAMEHAKGRNVLIVSPLMVIPQTIGEAARFYGDDLPIQRVAASDLDQWIHEPQSSIGITNYEAITKATDQGKIGALILDESSMLKSHYGKWGTHCIDLGRGLDWKLCLTGTPAPNDRIEYANHAVFLDHFPTVNSFLARFFVNRGQTNNRWELKRHAVGPFYRALSHWCLFLSDPSVYGWADNCRTLPPIHVHIHDVPLTKAQRDHMGNELGTMFVDGIGGIGQRSVISQLAKGHYKGEAVATNKDGFIRDLVESWPDESTLIWCNYNREQDHMERTFPTAASIRGDTGEQDRQDMVDAFKSGSNKIMVSKPKILGFGLNLQVCTRQVFSGLQDSYESYYQAVKRSNRVGSTMPLNVHIPVTELEAPMVENVLRKAKMVESDTKQQQELFMEYSQ